jgi:hypothetical protein
MADMDDTSGNSEVLRLNGLFYKMPQELSTTVKRSFVKEYSQSQTYAPQSTVVFDINTGSGYIDPANAMLSFDLAVVATATPNAGDTYTFGTGSACNLINEVRILSKNGTEVLRTQNANVLSKIMIDYKYSTDAEGVLNMAGRGIAAEPALNGTQRYVIPLKLFSSLFEPTVKGMKIPAGLASGMRIELTLESAGRALVRNAAGGTAYTYSMTNPVIYFMKHDLNDPAQSQLMANSAETGLEYTYNQYFNTPLTTTSLSINEAIKKSVARANRVFVGIFETANASDETADSFAMRLSGDLVDYQWRVGTSYYPNQVVTDEIEAWYMSQDTFDKIRDIKHSSSAVSLADYQTGGKFLLGTALESDSALNLSGVSLSNSNTLELRLNLQNAVERTLHIFTEYTTVSRTFVNSTNVKI